MTYSYKWFVLLVVLLLPFCASRHKHQAQISPARISEAVRMDVLESAVERRLLEMEADTPTPAIKEIAPSKKKGVDPIHWREVLPPE